MKTFVSAEIFQHPGLFSTVYAQPIERDRTRATIIWGDFRKSTRICVIWQDRPQPIFGQREIEIEGQTYRLRWLPPRYL